MNNDAQNKSPTPSEPPPVIAEPAPPPSTSPPSNPPSPPSPSPAGPVPPTPRWRQLLDMAADAMAKSPLQTIFHVSTAFGFLWLLLYWIDIRFAPDVTLSSLLLLLVSAAAVGGFIVVILGGSFLTSHPLWAQFWTILDQELNLKDYVETSTKKTIAGALQTDQASDKRPDKDSLDRAKRVHNLFFGLTLLELVFGAASAVFYHLVNSAAILCGTLAGLCAVCSCIAIKCHARPSSWKVVVKSAAMLLFIASVMLIPLGMGYLLVHMSDMETHDPWHTRLVSLAVIAIIGFINYLGSAPAGRLRTSPLETLGVLVFLVLFLLLITNATIPIARNVAILIGLAEPARDLYVTPEACSAVPEWLAGTSCTGNAGRNLIKNVSILSHTGSEWWIEAPIHECGTAKTDTAKQPPPTNTDSAPPTIYRFTLKATQVLSSAPAEDRQPHERCTATQPTSPPPISSPAVPVPAQPNPTSVPEAPPPPSVPGLKKVHHKKPQHCVQVVGTKSIGE